MHIVLSNDNKDINRLLGKIDFDLCVQNSTKKTM
jgi:hypothetical protein